jgi:glycosyltransferase involved in cell wall biosynthesis
VKVLFVVALPPPIHGSALVSDYVINLIEPKYDIHKINIGSRDVLSTYNSGVVKKIISGLHKLLRVLIDLSGGYDKVYFTPAINGLAFWRDIILILLIKLKNSKASVIFHMHNKGLENSYIKRILFNYITKNDVIIVLTKKLSVPYKSDVNIVKNFPIGAPKTSIRIKEKISRIGFLSNYIVEKGIKSFVDIAFEFRNTNLKFEAAGKDADCTRNELLSIVDSKGHLNLQVHGPKYDEDKWRFLDSLEVLLFPTTYSNECSPLVLMEAMSRGVLVVSFNEGGIEDMLPHDTICLVPGIKEMIEVLYMLINKPSLFVEELERQQLFFHSNFTEKNFKNEILTLFNE